MKKITLILLLIVIVFGCSKNNDVRPSLRTPSNILMRIQVVHTDNTTDSSKTYLLPNQ